jgi:hypothetical protein
MKFTELINKHWKNFLIVALLILLFIAFKQCKGTKDKHQALAAAAKSLEQKVRQDSIERAEERKAFVQEKQETEGRRLLAETEKSEADKVVQAQQKTIDRLAAAVRREGANVITSIEDVFVPDPNNPTQKYVMVPVGYAQACDSLPAEIDKLNLALADKDSAINEWSSILAYEVQIRDEEIWKEMNYSDSLLIAFHNQRALFNQAMKIGKPRGRLLGGISVLGNQNQFLSGAGVILAYQSKGGKQYQLSPKFIKVPGGSAEVFYEGAVLMTIFK